MLQVTSCPVALCSAEFPKACTLNQHMLTLLPIAQGPLKKTQDRDGQLLTLADAAVHIASSRS